MHDQVVTGPEFHDTPGLQSASQERIRNDKPASVHRFRHSGRQPAVQDESLIDAQGLLGSNSQPRRFRKLDTLRNTRIRTERRHL